MMHIKHLSVLLATLLAASAQNCNPGPMQCCNPVVEASVQPASTLLALLGIVLDPNVEVGIGCKSLPESGNDAAYH